MKMLPRIDGWCSTHLSGGCGAGVGKEAVVTVDAESTESSGVGRGVSDGVEHLLNRWKKD